MGSGWRLVRPPCGPAGPPRGAAAPPAGACCGWRWRCRSRRWGASLYQTADLGIAPYDYLSLGLRDYTPVPYFGCRVFTDALCALLCWLLGGLVGIGTLICAFCLGPFIQFFNGLVSEQVLHYKPGGQ